MSKENAERILEATTSGVEFNSHNEEMPTKDPKRNWVHATFRFFMYNSNGDILGESALIRKPNKFEISTGEYSWGYPKFLLITEFMEKEKAGFNQNIVIKCVVEQFTDMRDLEPPKKSLIPNENLSDLQKHMLDLLKTRQESDLLVRLNGYKYELHECILYCRAPILLQKLRSSPDTSFTFKDVKKWHMDNLIHFIYSNDLMPLHTLEDCIIMIYVGNLLQLNELVLAATKNLHHILTPFNAIECLLHPLSEKTVLTAALNKASTVPRAVYEHPQYKQISTNNPELIAELFDLITDKMIAETS